MRSLTAQRFFVYSAIFATLTSTMVPPVSASEISWVIRNEGSTNSAVQLALLGMPEVSNAFDPAEADLVATITTPESVRMQIPLFW